MGTSYFSNKYSEFNFDASDELAEKKSIWNPTESGKKKYHSGDSPIGKYTFLQSFAGEMEPKGKKLRDETVTIHEVDEAVKERIFRSDTALQSSSSNYNLRSSAGSKYSDFNTPKPFKAATQRFSLADNEPVSLISDDESDTSLVISSNDVADTEDSSGEQSLVQEIPPQELESKVVVLPTYVEFDRNCYWKAQLTFFCSSIKVTVSEEKEPMDSLTFEWKTADLVSIESKWRDLFRTADVCLYIKLEHPKEFVSAQKSGILKVNFTVSDPDWTSTQELIKTLDKQYKEKWDVDLDSYDSFEDITYQGDCDSISISKRDFELLHPEKFINDTIVDFYIEYLKKIEPADERVHFFNSFFFRKLADFDENQLQMFDAKAAFQRVRKWTKKVNIFQKDYIFIPVNFRLHWSLIIICHPGEAVTFEDEELEVSLKVPCILHMDSIKGSHRGLENCIKCYLWEEWKERSHDMTEYISTKFKNLRFIRLEVPQQQNSYDCGLFMLHYMELFMKQAPSSFNPLSNFVSKDWFYSTEASLKRVRIKRLIYELAKSKSEQVLSPKCSPEAKDANEEESEEVEILNETGNTCHESGSDTCLNGSRDVATPIMVKPLSSVPYEAKCEEMLDTGDDGGSLSSDDEEDHGKMVLYDPSIAVLSPIKESDVEEDVEKQVAIAGPTLTRNAEGKKLEEPLLRHLDKSLYLLRLKEPCGRSSSSSSDPLAAAVEQKDEESPSPSSSDDVFETCVVEDSDSDDSDHRPPCYRRKFDSSEGKEVGSCFIRKDDGGNRLSLQQALKRRQPGASEAQKRPRRSSSTDLQVISLCE